MGANVSNTVNKAVNDATIDALNKVMNSYANNTNVRDSINQVRTLDFSGAKFINCTRINVSQNANITASVIASMDTNTINAVSNEVVNEMMASLNEKIEQMNKDLNLFQLNVSNTENSPLNRFKTKMTNIISNEVENNVTSISSASQNDVQLWKGAEIDCGGGAFDASQNAVITKTVENIFKSFVDNKAKNDAVNTLIADLTTEKTQTNIGLNIWAIIGLVLAIGFVIIVYTIAMKATGKKAFPPSQRLHNLKTNEGKFGMGFFWFMFIVFIGLGAGLIAWGVESNKQSDETLGKEIDELKNRPVKVFLNNLGGPKIETEWENGDVIRAEHNMENKDISLITGDIVEWKGTKYIVKNRGTPDKLEDVVKDREENLKKLTGENGWKFFGGSVLIIIAILWVYFSSKSTGDYRKLTFGKNFKNFKNSRNSRK